MSSADDHVEEAMYDDDLIPVDIVPSPSTRPTPGAPVVLVVDDDPKLRTALVRALGSTFTIYEAGDGQEAKAIIDVISAPDAIVCDVSMPRVDGLTFAKSMRETASLRHIPILFLTARSSSVDVVAGINAGARHYLTKPFNVHELARKVGEMAKRAKR
jgi:DNA-binding response OmpR family regulator